MTPAPRLRPAVAADIDAILPRLRVKDAVDVMTQMRGSVEGAVRSSFATSTHAWVWEVDGQVGALFGVTLRSLAGGGALVWLFTTDAVERHRREFWQGSKVLLGIFLKRYGSIEGYCDARFLQSAQWLRRLGFELREATMSAAGVPFYHVQMVNHDRR